MLTYADVSIRMLTYGTPLVTRTVEEVNKHEALEIAEDIGKWFSGVKLVRQAEETRTESSVS